MNIAKSDVTGQVQGQETMIDAESLEAANRYVPVVPDLPTPFVKGKAIDNALDGVRSLFSNQSEDFVQTKQDIYSHVIGLGKNAPGKNKIDEAIIKLCGDELAYLIEGKQGREKVYRRAM